MSNNTFVEENISEIKLLMAEALKKLIKDRPFSKITVQDIVSECSINRNTFYYHFENNYDLLSFTYEQEVKKIVDSFHKAKATMPQAMEFVLDYIDKNNSLCICAYESLGEQQLKILFQKDFVEFVRATINYYASEKSVNFSEDFKTFVCYSYTDLLSTQITWYIRHSVDIDKEIFKKCLQVFFNASLKAVLDESVKRGL